jgi:hypothetical protein
MRAIRFHRSPCDLDCGMYHLYLKHKTELLAFYMKDLEPTNSLELTFVEEMAANHAYYRCFTDAPAEIPDDPAAAEKLFIQRAKLAMQFQAKLHIAYRRLIADRRRAVIEMSKAKVSIKTLGQLPLAPIPEPKEDYDPFKYPNQLHPRKVYEQQLKNEFLARLDHRANTPLEL